MLDEHRAATLRWRRNNAAMDPICHCGSPADIRVTDEFGFKGACPPYWWRCNQHKDVPLTVPWVNGRPLTGQKPEECSWNRSSTIDRIIKECGCGTHVGQANERYKEEAGIAEAGWGGMRSNGPDE